MGIGAEDQQRQWLAAVLESKKRGRGVVPEYRPFALLIASNLEVPARIFNPATPRETRLRLLKQTKGWPDFIESMYRGELDAAQQTAPDAPGAVGHMEPSERAEEAIANKMGMSAGQVRALCQKARNARKRNGDAEPDAIRVAEFWRLYIDQQLDGMANSPTKSEP